MEFSIVTGGTSGIGLAVALDLAAVSDLALIYRSNQTRSREAVAQIEKRFSTCKVRAFQADLGDLEQARRVFAEIEEWSKRPPFNLINCAGQSHKSFLLTDPPEAAADVLKTNFLSAYHATYFGARKMYQARRGRIVNVSSIAVEGKELGYAAYAAAKSAIETFTVCSAAELAARGVTLNCVRPGLVRTPGTQAKLDAFSDREKLLVPMEKVVAAIRGFLTPDRQDVTGQIVTVGHGNI